jgi:hypothetical protein
MLRGVKMIKSAISQQKQRLSVSGKPQDEAYCGILGFPNTRIPDPKCIGLDSAAHQTITKTAYGISYDFAIKSTDNPALCKTIDYVKPLLNFLGSKNIKYEQTYSSSICYYKFVINSKQDLCSQQALSLLDNGSSSITKLELTKANNWNQTVTSFSEACK